MSIIKKKGSHIAAMYGLTRQEVLFTVEMLKDMNPIRAGQACGIDPDHAVALSKKPVIRERLESFLSDRIEEAGIDTDWLLYELKDNHTLARQQGNLTASNKALETIGKLAPVDAFAANKHEHSGEVGLVVNVKRYSDEAKDIPGEVLPDDAVLCEDEMKGGGDPISVSDDTVSFL